jgi:hypothetical protein
MRRAVKRRNAPKTKTSQSKAARRLVPARMKTNRATSAPTTPQNKTW